MRKGSRIFKKSPLVVGLALAVALNAPVQSKTWDVGNVSITLDSTFSLGTGVRVEGRDFDKIGKSNQPNLDWTGYNLSSNIIYSGEDIWAINADRGSYSNNSDNSNLNYDEGEMFSLLFKVFTS